MTTERTTTPTSAEALDEVSRTTREAATIAAAARWGAAFEIAGRQLSKTMRLMAGECSDEDFATLERLEAANAEAARIWGSCEREIAARITT